MIDTAKGDSKIVPYYPYILVKQIFQKPKSEYGIEVQDSEAEPLPVEVEVVAFAPEFKENSDSEERILTHVGEHIFVSQFDSPQLSNGCFFVEEKHILGFVKENE